MRKLFVAAATLAILGSLASASLADAGGNGKGRGGGQQTTATSSIALEEYSVLHLGGSVGFTTYAADLAGWEYPMVAMWCYQDVNGDGIQTFPNDDGDLVYMQLDHPDVEFVLGGGSSDWLWNGGSAECTAVLYAYGDKGNNQSIRELASISFNAEG